MGWKLYLAILGVPLVKVAGFGLVLLLAESSHHKHPVGASAEATLVSPDGRDMGIVTITQGPKGIVLAADVQGLAPGGHSMSINSVGTCAPDFAAAGENFNPHGGEHGFLQGDGPHIGDLPNIYAADDGTARADFFAVDITLGSGEDHSLFDDDGTSIVISEKPDSYVEGADLGIRVACGVIRRN
ncbi:MAG: superoxide dismutase family protein [Chloroflexota bacterium]|nr:superoxide dismutase family protein [Chloroflexota bacterium]MDE2940987.1 superoxide dismutase family protein [Chloroflexota bacterium]